MNILNKKYKKKSLRCSFTTHDFFSSHLLSCASFHDWYQSEFSSKHEYDKNNRLLLDQPTWSLLVFDPAAPFVFDFESSAPKQDHDVTDRCIDEISIQAAWLSPVFFCSNNDLLFSFFLLFSC